MTILNVAIGEHDAALLTDARMSLDGIAADQSATKVLALPAHGALVAHSGNAMGRLIDTLHSYLLLGILGGDVLHLAQRLPQTLRDLNKANPQSSGSVVLVGVAGTAHGFRFQSPTWEAEPIPQGAQLMPRLRAPEDEPDATSIDVGDGNYIVQHSEAPAESRPPPAFKDSVRAIRLAAMVQLEQNPITCGGPLIMSLIDAVSIRQMREHP